MRRHVVLGLLLIGWLAALAAADTGGSMGGGDWGGGGGGGYSGGGGDYSSSDSYSYSSDGDSSSGGGGSLPAPVLFLILAGVVVFYIAQGVEAARTSSARHDLTGYLSTGSAELAAADVTVLRIALDGRARRYVQGELARIAKLADTATADGRLLMLREVGLMLRRARDAWVYGGAVNEPMRSLAGTKAAFDKHVDDARAKFRHETIRNAQGVVTTADAPPTIPRAHEGDGLILVTLVVAARTELFTVKHIADGEDLRKALEAASHRSPADLIAIEIVWQPSEETDRLSSLELEARYPHPALIPITGALVGKAFCTYCGGPFPAELVTCPHCGAPAPGHDRAAPRAA